MIGIKPFGSTTTSSAHYGLTPRKQDTQEVQVLRGVRCAFPLKQGIGFFLSHARLDMVG